ncbi:MAG: hypothetical protein K6E83_00815, partial [Clostridium sp.]|nr:hypothetical protein [Clostridium sp.]
MEEPLLTDAWHIADKISLEAVDDMKKLLSVLLAAAVCLSCLASGFAEISAEEKGVIKQRIQELEETTASSDEIPLYFYDHDNPP